MSDITFWGATGQSKVLHEALLGTGFALVALIENRVIKSPIRGVPVLFGEPGLDNLVASYCKPGDLHFAVAIGGSHGFDRLTLFETMKRRGLQPATIVHRTAFVAIDAIVGEACQIMALSAVCAGAQLGRTVIVNTSASVDHDCRIDDGVHIGPGVRIAGEVTIGARAFIGTGAIILPRIRIGEDAIVGAGAVVTKHVRGGTTVVGNPARPITVRVRGQQLPRGKTAT